MWGQSNRNFYVIRLLAFPLPVRGAPGTVLNFPRFSQQLRLPQSGACAALAAGGRTRERDSGLNKPSQSLARLVYFGTEVCR